MKNVRIVFGNGLWTRGPLDGVGAKLETSQNYDDKPAATSKKMTPNLGKLLHRNLKMLAEAGCKNVQIDEPLFTISEQDEVEADVEAVNSAGLQPSAKSAL